MSAINSTQMLVEQEKIKAWLYPGGLSYEPDLGVAVVAELELLRAELKRKDAEAQRAGAARARLLADKYVPWTNAGGPEECAHGRAAGIACPKCDRETVDRFFASVLGSEEKRQDAASTIERLALSES